VAWTENDKVRCWRQDGGGLKRVVRGMTDGTVRVPDVVRDIACWPGMAGYLVDETFLQGIAILRNRLVKRSHNTTYLPRS
jgi:hypothetical protein